MANLKNTNIDDTGFLELPSGTEAERPSNPQTGMIRFNTDIQLVEVYDGIEWGPLVEIPIDAQGGSVTEVTDGGESFRVHTFTSSGNFTVNQAPSGSTVEYLVVGGGGGGGFRHGGGAGAGGVVAGTDYEVSVGSYGVTVGSGGNGGTSQGGQQGDNSQFDVFTAIGGGGGHSFDGPAPNNAAGGSGGGGAISGDRRSGAALQPSSADGGFGNPGGMSFVNSSPYNHGGGGGAGQAGQSGGSNRTGNGGDGIESSISGTSQYYAGGGAGGSHPTHPPNFGVGGLGGGGGPSNINSTNDYATRNGIPNTGGGGTGGSKNFPVDEPPGGDGGSGIVIIRYPI